MCVLLLVFISIKFNELVLWSQGKALHEVNGIISDFQFQIVAWTQKQIALTGKTQTYVQTIKLRKTVHIHVERAAIPEQAVVSVSV